MGGFQEPLKFILLSQPTLLTVNDTKEFVLQTRPLFESHTAKNLSNVLKKAVDDWKIVRCSKSLTGNLVEKPIAITTDNATNFVKAVEIGGFSPHVRCFAHCLNLAA